jgi:hypothetical protein
MALMTQGDVVRRVQALLDDPAGRRFKAAYLAPYVDQENEDYLIELENLGAQMQEQIAIFNIPAAVGDGPTDLTPYYGTGQPLQYLMRPTRIDWKLQGQPNTSYIESNMVSELDDVMVGNLGCQQWRWAGGGIQTTPSYTPVTLRVYFDALAPTLFDPAGQVMRGVGNIIACSVALYVCSLNNNMGKLEARLEKKAGRVRTKFRSLMVQQDQAKLRYPRGTKRGGAVQISAGGTPYL